LGRRVARPGRQQRDDREQDRLDDRNALEPGPTVALLDGVVLGHLGADLFGGEPLRHAGQYPWSGGGPRVTEARDRAQGRGPGRTRARPTPQRSSLLHASDWKEATWKTFSRSISRRTATPTRL